MNVPAAATPSHVPVDLVVDVDIYALPGHADDPQPAWKALGRNAGRPDRRGERAGDTEARLAGHALSLGAAQFSIRYITNRFC